MRLFTLLAGAMLMAGMPAQAQEAGTVDANSNQTREAILRAGQANNAFGLDLFARLRDQDGNLFFSPYSISTAMALAYTGARGPTADQMARVLRWSDRGGQDRAWSPAVLAQVLGAAIADQNRRAGRGDYEWVVANALWGQEGFPFLADFLKTNEISYGGELRPVDFAGHVEAARATINGWVEEQTRARIQDLIPRGMLDRMTRLVLTNAIYFKGDWASPFDRERTVDRPFTLAEGKTVDVPMMDRTGRFSYAETDWLQVLEMPYQGHGLSMVVLLPKQITGLARLEQGLAPEPLAGWLEGARGREVVVTIPRFKLTGQFSLADALRAMGMEDAFSGAADFSGMTGRRDLFISAVVHKAFVAVDEKGTEAAAATGVTMKLTSLAPPTQPVVFRADHPFVFLIRDQVSGAILFMGRLADPGQGA
ncbi:MAG: serpin family protein [Phycisphaerae bacterium]|nr:serpin family protein [Phycisphaerae bacterium]